MRPSTFPAIAVALLVFAAGLLSSCAALAGPADTLSAAPADTALAKPDTLSAKPADSLLARPPDTLPAKIADTLLAKPADTLSAKPVDTLFAVPADTSDATNAPVDRIIVEKSKRRMTLLSGEKEVAVYRIALGRDPIGPKVMRGDNKTPEGLYFVDYKVRNSFYHRALHLTYPNRDDLKRADSLGVAPGSDIMIHGMGKRQIWMGDVQYLFDWTNGCIALTNGEIEEIWNLVHPWTPVEIRP